MPDVIPSMSVVMVDGSFRESYHSIDFFGKQTLRPEDYELIWVEYYNEPSPTLLEKLSKYPNFGCVTLNREGLYHSSFCFNAGIRESRGELIVIPDADVVVDESFLKTIQEEHRRHDELAVYCYRYDEPKDLHKAGWDLAHLRSVCRLVNPTNFGGCLSVRKKWLLEINGYEQHPIFGSGFHANGRDVYTRFKNLGLAVKWHPGIRLYHPWHPQTRVAASSYELQAEVVNHRAVSLETRAYQGLDPQRNVTPSVEMANRLRELDY